MSTTTVSGRRSTVSPRWRSTRRLRLPAASRPLIIATKSTLLPPEPPLPLGGLPWGWLWVPLLLVLLSVTCVCPFLPERSGVGVESLDGFVAGGFRFGVAAGLVHAFDRYRQSCCQRRDRSDRCPDGQEHRADDAERQGDLYEGLAFFVLDRDPADVSFVQQFLDPGDDGVA